MVVEWTCFLDSDSNRPYYVNAATNESRWERPADFHDNLVDGWQRLLDPETNQAYWYHTSSGETTWTDPAIGNDAGRLRQQSLGGDSALGHTSPRSIPLPKLTSMIPLQPIQGKYAETVSEKVGKVRVSVAFDQKGSDPRPLRVSVTNLPNPGPIEEQATSTKPLPGRSEPNPPHFSAPSHEPDPAESLPITSFLQQQLKRKTKPSLVQKSPLVATRAETNPSSPSSVAAPPISPTSEGKRPSSSQSNPEANVQQAPDSFVKPQTARKVAQELQPRFSESVIPDVKRVLVERSSSVAETEPTPTRIAIVDCPVNKRRQPPPPTEPTPTIVPNPSESSSDKQNRMLEHVVIEIVSSEKSYVASLQILVDVFIDRLAKEPGLAFLTDDAQVAMFFSNAEQVASLNATLLSDLESIIASEGPACAAAIGDLLLHYVKLFSVYTQYAKHYGEASEVLQSKALEAVFRDLQSDPRSQGQTMFSLGIMPVQRIPRYCLLLRELQRKLPEPVAQINEALVQVEVMRRLSEESRSEVIKGGGECDQ